MNWTSRWKRWSKLRFAILYPFGILALLFLNTSDLSLSRALPFIIAGLFIRVWANGYAIKMDKLTTSGPYTLVRNPLYFGTLLLIVGFLMALQTSYAGVLFFCIFLTVYIQTIQKEEKMLEDKFTDRYRDYKKHVPALIPTIFPYKQGEKWPFSFKRVIDNKEYKTFFWIIIVLIVFYVKQELMVEKEGMRWNTWLAVVIAFGLGLTDLIGEYFKRNRWNLSVKGVGR